jgi:hypothetical protein
MPGDCLFLFISPKWLVKFTIQTLKKKYLRDLLLENLKLLHTKCSYIDVMATLDDFMLNI